MELHKVFFSPVYVADIKNPELDLVQQDIKENLLKSASNNMPWPELVYSSFKFDEENKLLDSSQFLKKTIEQHLNLYLKNIDSQRKLKIEASWINIMHNQGFQFSHHHPGSIVSGVYYYQCSADDSDLVFENPNSIVDFIDPTGEFWHNQFKIKTMSGRLVLFPSWLKHRVELNLGKFSRIAIAFNTVLDS